MCVKAYDVDEVIQELRLHRAHLCKPDAAGVPRTLFVCLQNGVGSEEAFAAVFGSQYVVGATTTSPISIISPAVVRVERTGGIVALATMRPQDAPRVDRSAIEADLKTYNPHPLTLLVDGFKQSMLPCRVYSHYRGLKWSKLLLNILGNATGAILDMPAEALYADERLFGFEMQMLRETIAVMHGLGVSPVNLPRFPAATLTWAVRLLPDVVLGPVLRGRVAHGRGDKRPSFYYDVIKQKGKSEVTYLNGAVVAYGRRLGIPTPVNARLTEVLTGLVNGELRPDDWRGRVDRLLATGQAK
ncbi:MAG: ketopantoate reductase family protein [Chloroflexi bacterium]|nr:ketopantoate reductase family protein [Chloroflexota bacterium]